MEIIVDYREARSLTAQAPSILPEVMLSIIHVTTGDYLVDRRILFERKTLPGLVKSIKDGRLFSQASRLAASSYRSLMILEGTSETLGPTKMRREAIQGAIISLTLTFGISVLRSMNPTESAHLMVYASGQPRGIPRKGGRPKGTRKIRLGVLQGIPGSAPRARNL